MTPRPTYDDANLILRLYEMRREDRMCKARAWFTSQFRVATWEELQKLVWERLRPVRPEIRNRCKDPMLWAHLEFVGSDYATYFKSKSSEGYDAFLKRVSG